MIRKIIHIDEDKCNGCGLCATACHEARSTSLTARQSWCGRISATALVIVCLAAPQEPSPLKNERHLHMMRRPCRKARRKKELQEKMKHLHEGGCPGSRMRMLEQPGEADSNIAEPMRQTPQLRNWPVQIKLAPINAPYFNKAKLLIAADCTA